jgi:hypothetical protein
MLIMRRFQRRSKNENEVVNNHSVDRGAHGFEDTFVTSYKFKVHHRMMYDEYGRISVDGYRQIRSWTMLQRSFINY